MDPIIILQAGVASGTVLLFATLGEVFAERCRRTQSWCGRHDAHRCNDRLQRDHCHR